MEMKLNEPKKVLRIKADSRNREYIIMVDETNLVMFITIEDNEWFISASNSTDKNIDFNVFDYLETLNTRFNLDCDYISFGGSAFVDLYLHKNNYSSETIWK